VLRAFIASEATQDRAEREDVDRRKPRATMMRNIGIDDADKLGINQPLTFEPAQTGSLIISGGPNDVLCWPANSAAHAGGRPVHRISGR
jgi:hypothetical protein